MTNDRILQRLIYLSILTALVTVVLKAAAALVTGSVGLWSDALESTVNLVAALIALWALKLSQKPADDNHHFGHGKAEYLSAALEGAMIFIAAGGILWGAIARLVHPVPLEQAGIGLLLSAIATILNLVVGVALVQQGRKHRSLILEADGKHLLTDVWTSFGVLVAIGMIMVTGWQILDPIIAIIVGINVLYTGWNLVRRAGIGLLDAALPDDEIAKIQRVLDEVTNEHVTAIQLLTRESGRQRFAEVILQVPGSWTVSHSHGYADRIEAGIEAVLPNTETVVHIEPKDVEVSSARSVSPMGHSADDSVTS